MLQSACIRVLSTPHTTSVLIDQRRDGIRYLTCDAEVMGSVRWNLVGDFFRQPKAHHYVRGLGVVELKAVVGRYRDVVTEVYRHLEPHSCTKDIEATGDPDQGPI